MKEAPEDFPIESLKRVFQTVPQALQTYLTNGSIEKLTESIEQKHNLQADQLDVVEREIILLLLGTITPKVFTETLSQEAGISNQTISSIVQTLNTEVFMPLRKQTQETDTQTEKEIDQLKHAEEVVHATSEELDTHHTNTNDKAYLPASKISGSQNLQHTPTPAPLPPKMVMPNGLKNVPTLPPRQPTETPPQPKTVPSANTQNQIKSYVTDPYREPTDE